MAHRKRPAGKGAMMRAKMSKDPKLGAVKGKAGGKPGGIKLGAKGAGPHSAGQHHKIAKAAQGKQFAKTPAPGAALSKLVLPTAAPKKKKLK